MHLLDDPPLLLVMMMLMMMMYFAVQLMGLREQLQLMTYDVYAQLDLCVV